MQVFSQCLSCYSRRSQIDDFTSAIPVANAVVTARSARSGHCRSCVGRCSLGLGEFYSGLRDRPSIILGKLLASVLSQYSWESPSMLDEIEQHFWTNLLQTIWESWMLSRKSWASVLAHHRVENIRGGEFDSWFWLILEPCEGEEVAEVRFYIIDEWIIPSVFPQWWGQTQDFVTRGFHF